MTPQEIYSHLATGSNQLQCDTPIKNATSNTGRIQEIKWWGKDITVSVLFPGCKFDTVFYTNEDQIKRYGHKIEELKVPEIPF